MNNTEDLKEIFIKTLNHYSENEALNDMYWREVNWFYSHKHLHYHTLQHIMDMYVELQKVKIYIHNWNATILSLFYHDCHYKVKDIDNEEQSAKIAFLRLTEANIPQDVISKVNETILATKYHRKNLDQDINYFIDADLSILGKPRNEYENYAKLIRQEYAEFSDDVFNAGRKRVLENFLNQEYIYKTEHFQYLYEDHARENLDFEIRQL